MHELIKKHIHSSHKTVLDLFGGSGNLSSSISTNMSSRCVVDSFNWPDPPDNYFQTDLNSLNSVNEFQKQHKATQWDLFLIDPARKGFLTIENWCETFRPQQIIYISCNAGTLARDLARIPQYKIKNVYLLDMFPGTFHYEVLVNLHSSSFSLNA